MIDADEIRELIDRCDRLGVRLTADVESFVALGAEVCFIGPDHGRLWLVPAYTGQSRREVSAADLMRLVQLRRAFPGSTTLWNWEPEGAPS